MKLGHHPDQRLDQAAGLQQRRQQAGHKEGHTDHTEHRFPQAGQHLFAIRLAVLCQNQTQDQGEKQRHHHALGSASAAQEQIHNTQNRYDHAQPSADVPAIIADRVLFLILHCCALPFQLIA